jgi:23S rRNA (uracil1939-C5)-methyltransferase
VHYALPGELVEAVPAGRRGGASFARAVRIVESSPRRVQPPCPHFGECGGCQWQHAAYDYQLELKREAVARVWAGAGLRLPTETQVIGMADPWRYRVRGEFDAVYGGPELRFGFHRLRSHALLPIRICPLHDLRIERALEAFRVAAGEMRVDNLQNLVLTVEPTGPGILWQARFRGRAGALDHDVLDRVAELVPDLVLLDDSMTLEFWDLTFRVRTDTFIQTNYRQMLELYRAVIDMLEPRPGDAVLDLYAGIGTLSLAVAGQAARVTAIEENPRAVNLGGLAARINGIHNVRFLTGRVETVLRSIRLGDHDAAILDPPRAGCHPATLAELLRLGPERLVYVSCEPSTNARDLAVLLRGPYSLRRVALVDMFPQTYHIESVALLERT